MKEFEIRYIDELGTEYETSVIAESSAMAVSQMETFFDGTGGDYTITRIKEKK